MKEEWRPIPDHYPYEASDLGRIRNGDGHVMKTFINWQGYERIYLNVCRKNAKVHRLVAYAFLPKINGKDRVNHINCKKTDNRLSNLEWCNDSENMVHAHKNGLVDFIKGTQIWCARLDEIQVKTIKLCLEQGITCRQLADYFKVHWGTVNDIKHNRTWKHIGIWE